MSSSGIPAEPSKNRGVLFIISAPSGTGKSTLTRELLSRCRDLEYSVSMTTRERRPSETEGVEYDFTDESKFQKMIEKGKFAEYAKVHGHYYGTQKSTIDGALTKGRDILLDVDIQGAAKIRSTYPGCVAIFLMPPSLKVLEERLRNRGTEDEARLRNRLDAAGRELECAKDYDYVVVNENIENAAKRLCEIVNVERTRRGRG